LLVGSLFNFTDKSLYSPFGVLYGVLDVLDIFILLMHLLEELHVGLKIFELFLDVPGVNLREIPIIEVNLLIQLVHDEF
jgi:hypothetical protein